MFKTTFMLGSQHNGVKLKIL